MQYRNKQLFNLTIPLFYLLWAENFRIWDILNPDYLIWVSNGHTFDYLFKPFFFGYSRENPVFLN